MSDAANEDQDQRSSTGTNPGLEDSTRMTIEFLRARLLSERSVSRTARQRADELAERVMELEEQLKVVSLQRKKAEKATADVLAILQDHGICDASEAFDSDSEAEANDAENGKETSDNVKVRDNDIEEYLSSGIESTTSTGRSLSWKSSKDLSSSMERRKLIDTVRRRSTDYASKVSSPKHRGKSCRRIRHRETRPMVDEVENANIHAFPSNGVATCIEGVPNCSNINHGPFKECHEHQEESYSLEFPDLRVSKNQMQVADGNLCIGHGRGEDMERALQHQAQLIGQYQAEEQAQREWEEKFTENNSCAMESFDPGNHSDVTEERDEVKAAEQLCSRIGVDGQNQKAHLQTDVCFSKELGTQDPSQSSLHINMKYLHNQKFKKRNSVESPSSEFAFPMSKGDSGETSCSEGHGDAPPPNCLQNLPSGESLGNPLGHVSSSTSCTSTNGEASGSRYELALRPNENPADIGSVLGALQRVKLSLKQKLSSPLLSEGGSMIVEPSIADTRTGGRLVMPPVFPGLFRLPTDLHYEANTPPNLLSSTPRLSSASCSPTVGGDDKFFLDPFTVSRSRTSLGDQFSYVSRSPTTEIRSDAPLQRPIVDHTLDADLQPSLFRMRLDPLSSMGPSASGSYRLPPVYPVRSMTVPLHPSEELPRTFSSAEFRVPPDTRLPLYDDHIRPIVYGSTQAINNTSANLYARSANATDFSFYNDRVRPNMYM